MTLPLCQPAVWLFAATKKFWFVFFCVSSIFVGVWFFSGGRRRQQEHQKQEQQSKQQQQVG
jgi:hypothetical protein